MHTGFVARKIDNEKDFSQLRARWDLLLELSPGRSPFLTFEWMSAWWRNFRAEARPYLILVEVSGDLVGIAPLMLLKKGPTRILQFIGTGRSDYLDFILKGDPGPVIGSIINFLKIHREEWDLISLEDWWEESPCFGEWERQIRQTGFSMDKEISTVCPFLPCNGTWEDFIHTKSTKHRKNLKRLEARLDKNSQVEIGPAGSLTPSEQLDLVLEVEERSWKMDEGNPRISGGLATAFFREVFEAFGSRKWLETWFVRFEGKVVAYNINFFYNNKFYFYNVAYDQACRDLSPGTGLTIKALKDAFGRQALEYDFLRGDEPYKRLWTRSVHRLCHLTVRRGGLRSNIGFWALILPRWTVRRSPRLKNWVAGLRRILRPRRVQT